MSTTPRTDALVGEHSTFHGVEFVSADHARGIEIELATATAQRDALLACVKTSLPVLDDAEQDARERARLRITPKGLSQWLNVADCYKGDADAARAAITLAGGVA